jgi:hypothetical protein
LAAYIVVRPFLVMAWARDSASRRKASGNSSSESKFGAATRAIDARPAPPTKAIARRNPPRSSNGTISGAANASGAIVSAR